MTSKKNKTIPVTAIEEYRKQLPKPKGVLCMVKEEEFDGVSPGGILLPNITEKTQVLCTGHVIGVGEGMWNQVTCSYEPPPVKVGDRVLFIKVQSHMWEDPSTHVKYWFINMGNLLAELPELPKHK